MQTRAILVIAVVAGVALFVVGILIGHFGIKKGEDVSQAGTISSLLDNTCKNTKYLADWNGYRKSYVAKCVSDTCLEGSCRDAGLPRTYLAYHLNGEEINIDGRLDDAAWEDVPWTESFMDIRGPDYPKPFFDTKVKVRWDDERLYVGAWMQETDFWGTFTEDESLVWKENAFEVYVMPDGSMHNYKEMQISVRNVTWDLMLRKAYIDAGPGENVSVSEWSSDLKKATYTDGVINDPNGKGTYWSAEWSFSFAKLAESTHREQPAPSDGEAWFFIFARPEYNFTLVNGKYAKNEDAATEWWSWVNMGAVNLHLPSRFGLVQFFRERSSKSFYFDKWHIYRALFAVFEAEHRYKSTNGMFITDVKELGVSPKTMASDCVSVSITVEDNDFTATIKSVLDPNLQTGHIRADRYVWFT